MRINITVDLDPAELICSTAEIQVNAEAVESASPAAAPKQQKPGMKRYLRGPERRTEKIESRVTRRMFDCINEEATRRDCSVSDALRAILEEYFNQPAPTPAPKPQASKGRA